MADWKSMDLQNKDLPGVVGGSFHHGAVVLVAAALITAAPGAFPRSPTSESSLSSGGATSQVAGDTAMAEVQETCAQWAELAGRVMDLRQHGMPEEEAMDHTLGNAFLESLVMGAYEVRQLAPAALSAQETLQFKNRWYMNCLRGTANDNQH